MAVSSAAEGRSRGMSPEEKKVIFASSLGTVFEWYDFYLYGSLAAFIGATFFSPEISEATRNIFALLAFAAGFLVRPFGALVFGRLGDLVGRKYTFLVTMAIMGVSTFLVGVLPGYATIGILAPIILIVLRMLQGLALGGEYGGAATYVAEHSPNDRRGYYTSWIQTTATLGLFLSLLVILAVQGMMSVDDFKAYGWRIPFLISFLLLIVSIWIRLSLSESPTFQKMKAEGKTSKAPLSEAFGQWKNAKIALLALFGLTAGQAVVWYTGQFYALFFLTNVLKVNAANVNVMIAIALALGTGFFVFFGWLSDKVGRKWIIMAGLALAILTYFPLFKALTYAANPALATAQESVKVTVTAAPGDCTFQFNPVGTAKFTKSCDIATGLLARNSVPYDVVSTAAPGTPATVQVNQAAAIASYDSVAAGADAAAKGKEFNTAVFAALHEAGYPLNQNAEGNYVMTADPAAVNWPKVIGILFILVLYVTMVYGPIAAILVEMFPTRIRYTGMSLPYHIGNGWFGGLLPATVFAMSAAAGDIYYGLWYPIAIAAMSLIIGSLFVRDTLGTDLHAKD